MLLLDFDYDAGLAALSRFADQLDAAGQSYPYRFALAPNSGQPTLYDLDGDGRKSGPGDAISYGDFPGQGGMALLSRFSLVHDDVRNYSTFPWRDVPLGLWDETRTEAGLALSSVGHWQVPVTLSDGTVLNILAWHATTPAFDDKDDRNGRRNHDENLFWLALLDRSLPFPPPAPPFVLMGSANLDPTDGDGRKTAIRTILADPRLTDPKPRSFASAARGLSQGGANLSHKADPAFDTSDWRDDPGPGNLRAHYVLPSSDLKISDTGIVWPTFDMPDATVHGLIWVDIDH